VRLLRGELLKLQTTPRTVVGLILPLLAIVVLGVVGNITGSHEASTVVGDILDVTGFANVIALVLGVLIVTWEFRHNTIAGTFMVEPRRERVIAAKTAAAVLAGALLGVVSIGLALTMTYIWIGGDPGVSFDVWGRAARLVVVAGLFGAIGVGVGAIIRGQALAIVLSFIWFLIVEPLVVGLYDTVGRYLPGQALDRLSGHMGDHPEVGIGGAVALSLAYTIGIVLVGTVLTVRRDVT
jgi:ABC-type transport system involved in multi-copper enzyme maturation permease subunit